MHIFVLKASLLGLSVIAAVYDLLIFKVRMSGMVLCYHSESVSINRVAGKHGMNLNE